MKNLILAFLEEEAKKINLKRIELQARENAVSFYEKNGYQIIEKSFLLDEHNIDLDDLME